MYFKKYLVFGLALLVLTACGNALPGGTKKKIEANNQFRLHEIVWDVNLPDSWKRLSEPLDSDKDIPFFATDETQNVVILPGFGLMEDAVSKYIQNGEQKFYSFEVIEQTDSTLKFKGALAEGSDVSIFDQRIFTWEGSDDLFLMYSCNYPQNFSGSDRCGDVFDSIAKSE